VCTRGATVAAVVAVAAIWPLGGEAFECFFRGSTQHSSSEFLRAGSNFFACAVACCSTHTASAKLSRLPLRLSSPSIQYRVSTLVSSLQSIRTSARVYSFKPDSSALRRRRAASFCALREEFCCSRQVQRIFAIPQLQLFAASQLTSALKCNKTKCNQL